MSLNQEIENILKDILSGLQLARIYSLEHPKLKEAFGQIFAEMQGLFEVRAELTIGIVGQELAFENEIFFELSKRAGQVIKYLKNKGIEKIVFKKGLTVQELSVFMSYLAGHSQGIGATDDYLAANGVKNIACGKIKVSSGADVSYGAQESITYLQKYEKSFSDTSRTLESVLNSENIDALSLKGTISDVMDNLLGRYHEFSRLSIIKRRDLYTFTHLLNVTILSMHFASRLGFVREDVMEIGLSALFHDIGKMYIAGLVKKPGALTGEEFSRIKSHTILGAELLIKYSDNLGIAPIVVAFEHHLGYDLKGYPRTPFNRKPHQISYIVSICDVYDALLSRRSYKWDYPPDMVYEIMIKQRATLFEPGLLDEFFRIMGVWPIGTIVVLSDGRVAVVRKENHDDVFSPVVEVISDKNLTIDLKEHKDTLKIEEFLNPLAEGKEYLDKI